MPNLYFQHEMLIPGRNAEIYSSLYEIENWLRRIVLAACMIKYGKDWASQINSKIAAPLEARLKRTEQLSYLGVETDSNLIWATMHRELHLLLFGDDLWPIVEALTNFPRERLSAKLGELNDFRNLLAHNRAFSAHTETQFRGLETAVRVAIENFKTAVLYSKPDILREDDQDPFNLAFQRHMAGNDWTKFQGYLAKNRFFYVFACLPIQREHDPAYVSGRKLLESYKSHLDIVVAFTVNKSADEYCVLIPFDAPTDEKEELSRVFTRNLHVWTSTDYTNQDPQFIAHPKIWFYENRRPAHE